MVDTDEAREGSHPRVPVEKPPGDYRAHAVLTLWVLLVGAVAGLFVVAIVVTGHVMVVACFAERAYSGSFYLCVYLSNWVAYADVVGALVEDLVFYGLSR